jgi:DNA-binding NtrC family response regulator
MVGLLIADKNMETRQQMANLLIKAGYDVTVTDSAVKALHGVLKKTAQVVLLGTALDELTSGELIPLLKRCNRNLMIILVADDAPLPMIRKARTDGIFYHALRPEEPEGEEEIRQVVKCAMDNLNRTAYTRKALSH